jgi:ERF superfamily.
MKIYSQLLNFQNKLRKVNKDAKGYNYSYASFDNVVDTISSELQLQGLGFTHTFEGQDIVCTLFNAEGDAITSKLTLSTEILKGMNASQSMGAAITYARRYTLTAILGLVTDDDTDGVVNTPKAKQNTPQGQNMDDDKPWLNVDTADFTKVVAQTKNYAPDDLVRLARKKYKVSKTVEQAIRAEYQDNYEDVVLVD